MNPYNDILYCILYTDHLYVKSSTAQKTAIKLMQMSKKYNIKV